MNTVSEKDLQLAREAVEAALQEAYAPIHKVGNEMLCWEGRITNTVDKADALIKGGKLTQETVYGLLEDFRQNYDRSVATVQQNIDRYVDLCQKAGVKAKVFTRPACGCRFCKDRVTYTTVEQYKRAIMDVVDSGFQDNEALALARHFADLCSASGVTVTINMV